MIHEWRFTIDGQTIDSRELKHAEWEMVCTLVNQLGRSSSPLLPDVLHQELEIDPLHCPTCRSAIALTALTVAGVELDAAIVRVANMDRGDLLACVEIIEPAAAEDEEFAAAIV